MHISPPSCVSLPPSLSHPSRWSQSTELISLCYAAASHYDFLNNNYLAQVESDQNNLQGHSEVLPEQSDTSKDSGETGTRHFIFTHSHSPNFCTSPVSAYTSLRSWWPKRRALLQTAASLPLKEYTTSWKSLIVLSHNPAGGKHFLPS